MPLSIGRQGPPAPVVSECDLCRRGRVALPVTEAILLEPAGPNGMEAIRLGTRLESAGNAERQQRKQTYVVPVVV